MDNLQIINKGNEMAFQHKENSGSLFKNEKKVSDTHPDLTGEIMVGGKLHFLSAWRKEGKKGPYYSISIGKEKIPQGFREAGSDELLKKDPFVDDIPF